MDKETANQHEIYIPNHVFNKVMYWVNNTDIEVSGFGTVKYNQKQKQFEIINAYLLSQEGGATHTDIDGTDLARLAYLTRNEGELRWWWHSHVQMKAFWSGTDTNTIKEMGLNGWIIATVFNQMEEHKSALCYKSEWKSEWVTDFGNGNSLGKQAVLYDDLKTVIESPYTVEDEQKWEEEFRAKVKEKQPAFPSWPGTNMDYNPRPATDKHGNQWTYERGITTLKPSNTSQNWERWNSDKDTHEVRVWDQKTASFVWVAATSGNTALAQASAPGSIPASYKTEADVMESQLKAAGINTTARPVPTKDGTYRVPKKWRRVVTKEEYNEGMMGLPIPIEAHEAGLTVDEYLKLYTSSDVSDFNELTALLEQANLKPMYDNEPEFIGAPV